jgi:hypothetical protein
VEHGYNLVEVSGDGMDDRGVTLIWKQRTINATTKAVTYELMLEALSYRAAGGPAAASFSPADTSPRNAGLQYINYSNGTHLLSCTIVRTGRVTLTIYRLNGQPVVNVVDADLAPGTYRFAIRDCAAGVYVLAGCIGSIAVHLALSWFSSVQR